MRKCKVLIKLCGDYCAFHEASFEIVGEIGDELLKDLNTPYGKTYTNVDEFIKDNDWDATNFVDYDIVDVIEVDGELYIGGF